MKTEKSQVRSSIKKVKDFFGIAASMDGKVGTAIDIKSENMMGKASGKRNFIGIKSHSAMWTSVIDFETSRSHAHSIIIGISGGSSEESVKGIHKPYLIISANDLNSKNFAKQLGRTMLEPACVICIDTIGLNNHGSKRLKLFLKNTIDMFDARVCLALCVSEDTYEVYSDYIEKKFQFDSSPILPKLGGSSSKNELEEALRKVKEAEENMKKIKKENDWLREEVSKNYSRVKCAEDQLETEQVRSKRLEEDNMNLRSKLNDLEASVSDSDVIRKEKESLKFQLETSETSRKEVVEKNKELTEKLRNSTFDFKLKEVDDSRALKNLEEKYADECKLTNELKKEIQTLKASCNKSEQLTGAEPSSELGKDSQLAILKERLLKNEQCPSAVTRIFRSVKDFKYTVDSEVNDATNTVKCQVTITRGRIIMNHPTLTKFSGEGHDEESAKEDAFKKLILSIVTSE